jgi:hypothetical protein
MKITWNLLAAAALSGAAAAALVSANAYTDAEVAGLQPAGNYITALTGDVTATGPGSVAATIANDSVTFAKMQNISVNHLIGRHSSGSGDPQQVGIDGGLEINGANLRVADDGITLAKLANLATQRVIGRNSSGTGDPEAVSLTQLLDWIGSAAIGDMIVRGASAWERLAAGTSGYLLQANGAALPSWSNKIPSAFITSQVDNATQVEANVTGLSFAVETNSTYFIIIGCALECSGAGGIQFGHTYPTASLMLTHWGRSAAATSIANLGLIYASATGTGLINTTFNAVAAATGYYCAHLVLRTTAAGTYQLTFAAVAGGQTASVRAGSGIVAIKIG